MALRNFKFDGKDLKEQGYAICSFDGASSEPSMGSRLTFNNINSSNCEKSMMTSVKYTENLSTHIQICKIDCSTGLFKDVTQEDIDKILYWLNTDNNCELKLYDDKQIYNNLIFIGSFTTVDLIKKNGDVVGFDCAFESCLPYALEKEIIVDINLTHDRNTFSIDNKSNKNTFTIPKMIEIDVLESGNLTIENKTTGYKTIINNCIKGERIIINQEALYLTSDDSSHDVNNDFNYTYIKLSRNKSSSINDFVSSLSCNIKFYINYARRVGIL